jgi:C4-type Zn-finger protein
VLGKRALDLGGSAHGVLSTVEGHEERVALVVDLRSAEVDEDRSQQAMMLFQQRRVALAEGREQLRRALDVREQERRSGSAVLAHAAIIAHGGRSG